MTSSNHNDYRKIRKEGGSRVIAVGTLLPTDWKVVKLVYEDAKPNKWVRVRIEKVA